MFQQVDVERTGTLSLQEFVSAYQIIFTDSRSSSERKKSVAMTSPIPTECICILRYGSNSTQPRIFEMFLGWVKEKGNGQAAFEVTEKRTYRHFQLSDTESVSDLPYDSEPNYKASLEELNALIVQDALANNKTSGNKVYWWVDIAMSKMASHRVDKYLSAFGLPNDSKFRAMYGQYGSCLPAEEHSRIYAANGRCALGGVSSLSLFVQGLWIRSMPIVHHIPAWMELLLDKFCLPTIAKAIKLYYTSRFAFLLGSTSRKTNEKEEQGAAYNNAQMTANVHYILPLSLSPPPYPYASLDSVCVCRG